MTVVPTNCRTFYARFMDLHVLWIPLRDTAANMPDTFDLRQGFLMQFISELTPSMQQAVQMRYRDGLSISETAQMLEVPVATIKGCLWRARVQLKRMMSDL
jgi:DNA-directed RNA polymerase specialized sigma24 family protein